MITTAKLLLHCPDKPGILAEVTVQKHIERKVWAYKNKTVIFN